MSAIPLSFLRRVNPCAPRLQCCGTFQFINSDVHQQTAVTIVEGAGVEAAPCIRSLNSFNSSQMPIRPNLLKLPNEATPKAST
jgi:hypothetical protein